MSGSSLVELLSQRFGDKITGSNLEAIDPWIEVSPNGIVEVCEYLRDDPDLRLNLLNCISGVDYCMAEPKKAAKPGWEPHLEIV